MADTLDRDFLARNINMIRDERDLGYKENIKVFMNQISNADYALLLISDTFLKSANCMYEVLELLESAEFENRVLPIVIEGADVFSPEGRSDYIEYWQQKQDVLEEKLRNQKSITDSGSITSDLNHYKKIRGSIDRFLDHLNGHLHYSFEEIKNQDYKPILTQIGGVKKKS